MAFRYEKDLVNTTLNSIGFKEFINLGLHETIIEREVKGFFGVPDVVIAQKRIKGELTTYAFEFKLTNWKKALIQAFRYRAFAKHSIVIIDQSKISSAVKKIEEFKKVNVGLIGVNNFGEITIYWLPDEGTPYSPSLHFDFESYLSKSFNHIPSKI